MRPVTFFLLSLLAVGALAVARPAAAQWDFTGVCETSSDVPDLFDPNAFVGVPKCESLCAKSASYCAKFVKAQGGCFRTSVKGGYALAEKAMCDTQEDPNDRKECKANIKDILTGFNGEIGGFIDDQLQQCQAFETACREKCLETM